MSKEGAADHYAQNKESINKKSRECYENLSQEEKEQLKSIKAKDIKNWFSIRKKS